MIGIAYALYSAGSLATVGPYLILLTAFIGVKQCYVFIRMKREGMDWYSDKSRSDYAFDASWLMVYSITVGILSSAS